MSPFLPRLLLLLLLTAIGIAWYFNLGAIAEEAFTAFHSLGYPGVVLFIVTYVLATILLVPVSLLSLAAGAMYGLWAGFLYVSIAANLGAASAFLLGRYLARGKVQSALRRYPRFSALDRAIGDNGWQLVALCRLSPVFPFNALNYLFSITPVRFSHYAIATLFGMLPGTFLYLYIGSLAGDIAGNTTDGANLLMQGLGVLSTLAVTIYLARIAQRSIMQLSGPTNEAPERETPAKQESDREAR